MKMKSFAMLAMSGLMATSIAYVAPAMAEDDTGSNGGQSMQTPSDNGMQNPGGNNQNNPGSLNDSSSDNSNDMNNSNNMGGSSNSTDEGSPDTATGDDDY